MYNIECSSFIVLWGCVLLLSKSLKLGRNSRQVILGCQWSFGWHHFMVKIINRIHFRSSNIGCDKLFYSRYFRTSCLHKILLGTHISYLFQKIYFEFDAYFSDLQVITDVIPISIVSKINYCINYKETEKDLKSLLICSRPNLSNGSSVQELHVFY